MNRVTLYRILDRLVEKGLVRRLSASDRTFRYGLGGSSRHPDHAHFHCMECGAMECLDPELMPFKVRSSRDLESLNIQRMEIRLDGLCQACGSRDGCGS
jgi:Fur family ferric uptake transcriptional regulator